MSIKEDNLNLVAWDGCILLWFDPRAFVYYDSDPNIHVQIFCMTHYNSLIVIIDVHFLFTVHLQIVKITK